MGKGPRVLTTQERESDYFHFDLEGSIKKYHSLVSLGLWHVAGLSKSSTPCSPYPRPSPLTDSSAQQTGCHSTATGQTLAWQTSRTPGIWEAMTTWGSLQTLTRQFSKEKTVCVSRMLSPWESRTGPVPILEGKVMARAKDILSPCRSRDYH